MLRASSQTHEQTVDLNVVMSGEYSGDVAHGDALIRLAEAVVNADVEELAEARAGVVETLGEAAMVDALGVASNFQRMVRIADSTGIELGDFETATADLRAELGINAFAERAS